MNKDNKQEKSLPRNTASNKWFANPDEMQRRSELMQRNRFNNPTNDVNDDDDKKEKTSNEQEVKKYVSRHHNFHFEPTNKDDDQKIPVIIVKPAPTKTGAPSHKVYIQKRVLEQKSEGGVEEIVKMQIEDDTEQTAKIKKTQSCASACFNCNCLRGCVRGKKRKVSYGNIDLDMTYITKHIVAAGFPATGVQAFYRNKRGDLVNFLQGKHGNMVKIYNLCAEPEM